jgi:hypothetical protein
VYKEVYAPAMLIHGKWLLLFIGWATAVLVMNMADPLSADFAVVIQCIVIYCTKLPELI